MIYIAICEDNEESAKLLKYKVTMLLKDYNVLAEMKVYTQSRMLQYDIQEGRYFDLILSDIEMPDIDGMVLAAYIKKYLSEVLIRLNFLFLDISLRNLLIPGCHMH